ncbi:MAG: hypothetical protein MJZ65_01670 [Paludibacteraceae bacterium]|nr:hypothetical protein [Paludibacteraceae bacterium]
MNILILSNAYKAPNYNARLRYWCDYWVQQGHQIEVFTEPWSTIPFDNTYPIHEFGAKHTNFLQWLLNSLYSFITNRKERKFAYSILWAVRKSRFDLVFCSTNSCFPLNAAAKVAKLLHLPLHVDITELRELVPDDLVYDKSYRWLTKLNNLIYTRRRNQTLACANSITTVSPAHVKAIEPINPHVTLLYNGFNPDLYFRKDTPSKSFRISYIGTLTEAQPIDLLLKAMQPLHTEIPELQWCCYCNKVRYEQLSYRFGPTAYGTLPKELIPDTIRQSSIIFFVKSVDANNLQDETFYQTIGCEKPMLLISSEHGPLANIITLAESGVSTKSTDQVQAFIREKYQEWKQNGYTHQPIANKDLFNARLQVEQLTQMLQDLIQK